MTTEQHNGDTGDVLRDALGGLDARSVGHMDVEEHNVGDDVARALERFAARGNFGHYRVSERRQQLDEQRSCVIVVLSDQDTDLGGFTHLARICTGTEWSARLGADSY